MKCALVNCEFEAWENSNCCAIHLLTKDDNQCHALPALEDKQSSRPSGAKPKNEPSDSEDLTLRQSNSVKMILEMIQLQAVQINELTKGVEYLAQQVKTLVDALAEDQDPDAPLTHYMSGKPI